MAPPATPPSRPTLPAVPFAAVRLEVRAAGGRGTIYEVGDGGFLIGSVPGCDLRLPGANLPPVLCLVARQAGGASLRKLAPVLPVAVNGRAVSSTYLRDGDHIALAGVEMVVSITLLPGAPSAAAAPVSVPSTADLEERLRLIDEREQQLQEASAELENDRAIWYRRRDEIEAECRRHTTTVEELVRRVRQQEREVSATRTDLDLREQNWRAGQEEVARQQQELQARAEELQRERGEILGVRQELGQIRQQLLQRYQERRDRLLGQKQAVRKAARKVQERKQDIDGREARLVRGEEEYSLRVAEVESRAEQIDRERQILDDQHRLFASRQQELQRELAERQQDLRQREQQLGEERTQLDKSQKQHQTDLVRLDRIQASLEQKQKNLEQRALEIDHRFEQLQRDTRELEEQARQLDEWHNRLVGETEQRAIQKKEQDGLTAQLEQRANTLEGQQAMLATLRTRLERMREELRRQEQTLADQRVLQEAGEQDLRRRLEEAEQLRSGLTNDKQLFEEEHRRFEERQGMLDGAVQQLRLAQDALEARERQLHEKDQELTASAADQAEQAGVLLARGNQLQELHARLTTEQQTLRDRESGLARAEQTLASLQEQVRRRSEELNERQKAFHQGEARLREEQGQLEAQRGQLAEEQQRIRSELDQLAGELAGQTRQVDERQQTLRVREEGVEQTQHRLDEAQRLLASQRQALATERITWEVEKQAAQEETLACRAEMEAARDGLATLHRQLPELETRAVGALDRLTRAREQLREHLSEVHVYARQSRDDLEAARKHVQNEVERVRQQELALQVARDEHRLSVAAFRQQLIEWQGQVGEMKQSLEHGATRLDQRKAQVDEQAQVLASVEVRLRSQAQQLEQQQQQVAQKRGEVDRHLLDMREWYRRKLRELSGVDLPPTNEGSRGARPGEGDVLPLPAASEGSRERGSTSAHQPDSAAGVVRLGDIEPIDQQLGEMLHSLELIDGETLTALLLEARRQRRSLRQLLLAGNYLTLHQLALIEAGNLDALVLGPVRVIDRVQSTPRETVYRVFDPRRNAEVLLRHLAEGELQDAIHPDEFRQRFTAAAAVQHANLANVLEVLEINDRPAVLIEWTRGLPSGEWPTLVGAPGAWFRLVSQAALALTTVHAAGLCHGQLRPASFVLTDKGALKLCGLGEPRWLVVADDGEAVPEGPEDSPARDLVALGQLAAGWAALGTNSRAGKAKGFPTELLGILTRLQEPPAQGDEPGGYASALELLEDLEKAGAAVPASSTAWDRLLRQVREQVGSPGLRRSA